MVIGGGVAPFSNGVHVHALPLPPGSKVIGDNCALDCVADSSNTNAIAAFVKLFFMILFFLNGESDCGINSPD
jgi:hypothetical protein